MSSPALISRGSAAESAPARRKANFTIIVSVIWIVVLIGTEIYAIAIAGIWAIVGLLHIGPSLGIPLYLATFAIATVATIKTAQLAWTAETDPENE